MKQILLTKIGGKMKEVITDKLSSVRQKVGTGISNTVPRNSQVFATPCKTGVTCTTIELNKSLLEYNS